MPGALQAPRLASEGRAPGAEPAAAPGTAGSSVFYHAEGETELPESGALFDDAEGTDEEPPPEPSEGARPGGPEAAAGLRLLGQRSHVPRTGSGLMRLMGLWLRPEPALPAEDECRRRAQHLAEGAPQAPGQAADVALPPAALAPRLAGIDSPVEHAAEKGGLSGTFEKRSPWWVEGWRPRTYRLCDRKLLYFRKDRPDRPQGVLDFSLVRFELHCCWQQPGVGKPGRQDDLERPRSCNMCDVPGLGDNTKTFYLKPVAFSSKVFAFRGPADEMEALTARIAKLVAAPMPSALPHERMVLSLKNFWRYPFVREHEFKKQAESADILLFRGKDGAAKLQRAATGADYDHVALLMKSVGQEVFILEATGCHGVKIISWDYFTGRGWHKCYAWMAVRKVYFQRTPEQLQALQTYVASVLGRPYGLSLGKLVGKTTSVAYNEQGRPLEAPGVQEGQEGGHETLFCSQLAAACLKRCGVLASARASSRYWPSSFSQHCPEPLPLQEHAHVGEEQLIVFGA